MSDRFSRQIRFFPGGEADQRQLGRARVALIGCGALGTVIAGLLARAGVGFLRIVDRDIVELSNLQRQTLFDEADAQTRLPKAVAAAQKLAQVNSELVVDPRAVDFDTYVAENLLADVDLVMDGTDNFEARYLLNDTCVKLSKPWIYSAAVGSYGVTMNIRPGQTPCLRCIFPVSPTAGATESCDVAGVIAPIGGVIGSLAAAEAFKLLIGAHERLRPGLLWVDVWNNSYQTTPVADPSPDCPTCQRRSFEFLESGSTPAAQLCGRDAVQVRPLTAGAVNFDDLGPRLRSVGQVTWNPHLLRFAVDGFELTLFPDSRAIVKGTADPTLARTLYARYIGA